MLTEQRSPAEPAPAERPQVEAPSQTTMAQAAPPSEQDNRQRQPLPNSSSPLPLIALVGFIGMAAGALLRR